MTTSTTVLVYAVVDKSLSPTSPLGDAVETFLRREDAERFVDEVRGDDPELARHLRIEERELDGSSTDELEIRELVTARSAITAA